MNVSAFMRNLLYSTWLTLHSISVHVLEIIILKFRNGTLGAGDLAREAYTRGSTDNISLIIIDFNSSSS